ncbi:cysteate synthase [Methanogenium organophilum]|uniref:Cysteate synthase n=1 Tax=Methanogenium organophilum TaxID=2199 RepID=A0A9X9S264_METOG|nr:cysteate synthase [Methanogenium organophilum]WAI00163.1 cysteate synthase [Methanogenium organophilum]
MTEKYTLKCPDCSEEIPDRYTNVCPTGCTGLIRAYYWKKQLDIQPLPGIFRFSDWLPVEGHLPSDAGPITYKSEALAQELGLSNLYIGFSGYWPERGAAIESCSFKELEALPTTVRMKEKGHGILQISSAGNTGRAFCQVSALTGAPVVVVVPESSKERLWTTTPAENVCLITVEGDYTDSIEFGNAICSIPGIVAEGGARNVARRDGMGTVMLDGAVTAGRLPDYYFQAVGSGTGGIAAWEASMRLVGDGRFGTILPHLYLTQNEPFVPMMKAWQEGRREILPETDMADARRAISQVYADVLTNRHPPYSVKGGVYDALSATGGTMDGITNVQAKEAEKIFIDAEEIDPDPAASVCVASLIKAVETGTVGKDDYILLNIAGGGYKRVAEDKNRFPVEPMFSVKGGSPVEEIRSEIDTWVNGHA